MKVLEFSTLSISASASTSAEFLLQLEQQGVVVASLAELEKVLAKECSAHKCGWDERNTPAILRVRFLGEGEYNAKEFYWDILNFARNFFEKSF